MPYTGPLRLRINGAASGTFAVPCDGGRTTIPAVVDMKLGWTAAEVTAAATASLELRLTDNDILTDPDPYAVMTFAASAANPAVAAPAVPPFTPAATKWTGYTARFEVFCAKYGCILCARDSGGVIGSQGESQETFKGFFVLTTATDSADGRTTEEVVVTCDANVSAVTPIALAPKQSETFLVADQPSGLAISDWVYLMNTIVEGRLNDALTQRFPRFLVVDEELVEPF
jgi:hypothetical protein